MKYSVKNYITKRITHFETFEKMYKTVSKWSIHVKVCLIVIDSEGKEVMKGIEII